MFPRRKERRREQTVSLTLDGSFGCGGWSKRGSRRRRSFQKAMEEVSWGGKTEVSGCDSDAEMIHWST
jgi:hypothetical protein